MSITRTAQWDIWTTFRARGFERASNTERKWQRKGQVFLRGTQGQRGGRFLTRVANRRIIGEVLTIKRQFGIVRATV